MHLPDPLSAVNKALSFLKAGCAFAAQEPINSACFIQPEDYSFIKSLQSLFRNIFCKYEVDYDIGKNLHTLFFQAGCYPIHLHFTQRAIPIKLMKDLLLQYYEEIRPAALKSGALSKEDLANQMITIQKYPEGEDSFFAVPQQAYVTGYKRK